MKGYSLYEDETISQESILGTLGSMLGIAVFIFLGYFLVKLGIESEKERRRVREYVIRMLRPYIPKFKKAYDNYDDLVSDFNRKILPALLILQLFDGYRLDLRPQNTFDQDDFIEELVDELVYAITTDESRVKHGEFPGYLEISLPCAYIDINNKVFKDENGKLDKVKIQLLEYSIDKIIRNISNKDSKLTVDTFSPYMNKLTIYVTIKVDITTQDVKEMRKMMDRGTISGVIKDSKISKEAIDFSIPEKYIKHSVKLLKKHIEIDRVNRFVKNNEIIPAKEGIGGENILFIIISLIVGGILTYDKINEWLKSKDLKTGDQLVTNALSKYQQQIDTVRKEYVNTSMKIYQTVFSKIEPVFKKYIEVDNTKESIITENFNKTLKHNLYYILSDIYPNGKKNPIPKNERYDDHISKNGKLGMETIVSFSLKDYDYDDIKVEKIIDEGFDIIKSINYKKFETKHLNFNDVWSDYNWIGIAFDAEFDIDFKELVTDVKSVIKFFK